jgi:hypothetical protein
LEVVKKKEKKTGLQRKKELNYHHLALSVYLLGRRENVMVGGM